jgi:predicted dehydrogenase
MFHEAICSTFKERCELVGLCDINGVRMDLANQWAREKFGQNPVPTHKPDAFEAMVKGLKPDVVVVTCLDRLHHHYIIRAMELGCDVISEKPMTVDDEKAREIIAAKKRTGRNLTVTFNYRYSPRNTKVKELIHGGAIGDVVSVHFEWMLDTAHGADYFRRWHRDKRNSGGLLVHKSTHHFDLVNWWIDSVPEEVFAWGRLAFYGRENAERRGVTEFYQRVKGSEAAKKDPFALNIDDKGTQEMYLNAEKDDGYQRDQSVFGDGINIEDTMSVLVKYRNRAVLTYSLNAFCPWEGYRVMFNGTKGRLEMDIVERPFLIPKGADPADPSYADKGDGGEKQAIRLQRMWQKAEKITWEEGKGGHGGGDGRMLTEIFEGANAADPLKTAANHVDGLKSIIVGIAGNHSLSRGLPIRVKDLVDIDQA